MMREKRNVLLALGWFDHRLLQGIADYATTHNWHLSAASIYQEFIIPWGWQGDGILAWLAGEDELADFVVSAGKPTVDFSMRRSHLPFARVAVDNVVAAKMAAKHFLQRGFRHFLFYSVTDLWVFEERGAAFVSALREHGHGCQWIKWHEVKKTNVKRHEQWMDRRVWLTKALKAASKPLAVFAANGTLAVEVLDVCEAARIDVPTQVALIGVEDDLLLQQSTHSITSIELNYEKLGYEGAALLDWLMAGAPKPKEPIRIPPTRIITRQSTEITAVSHPGVAKALRFIADKFSDDIDVNAIARVAGLSRRGLHQAFLEHLGYAPGEQLRAARLEHAKKLLAETDSKIDSIASRSGYASVTSFFIAFKQVCKTTPAEFRKEARRGREGTRFRGN